MQRYGWYIIVSALMTVAMWSCEKVLALDRIASLKVTDFGAKGDGKTDDTAAIQQASNGAAKHASRARGPGGLLSLAAPEVTRNGCMRRKASTS